MAIGFFLYQNGASACPVIEGIYSCRDLESGERDEVTVSSDAEKYSLSSNGETTEFPRAEWKVSATPLPGGGRLEVKTKFGECTAEFVKFLLDATFTVNGQSQLFTVDYNIRPNSQGIEARIFDRSTGQPTGEGADCIKI